MANIKIACESLKMLPNEEPWIHKYRQGEEVTRELMLHPQMFSIDRMVALRDIIDTLLNGRYSGRYIVVFQIFSPISVGNDEELI